MPLSFLQCPVNSFRFFLFLAGAVAVVSAQQDPRGISRQFFTQPRNRQAPSPLPQRPPNNNDRRFIAPRELNPIGSGPVITGFAPTIDTSIVGPPFIAPAGPHFRNGLRRRVLLRRLVTPSDPRLVRRPPQPTNPTAPTAGTNRPQQSPPRRPVPLSTQSQIAPRQRILLPQRPPMRMPPSRTPPPQATRTPSPPPRAMPPPPRPAQPPVTVLTTRQQQAVQNRPQRPPQPPPAFRPPPPQVLQQRPPPMQTRPTPPPTFATPQANRPVMQPPPPLPRRPATMLQPPRPPPTVQTEVRPSPTATADVSHNSVSVGASPPPRGPTALPSSGPPTSAIHVNGGPPGSQPPNDDVVSQLNNAIDFMAVAERLKLRRLVRGRMRRHADFIESQLLRHRITV